MLSDKKRIFTTSRLTVKEKNYLVKSVRQRQILYVITYMWNLKNNTNQSIYKTETDSQTQKTNLWLPQGKEGDKLGVWN